jgi:hypothetical protein
MLGRFEDRLGLVVIASYNLASDCAKQEEPVKLILIARPVLASVQALAALQKQDTISVERRLPQSI